MKICLLTERMKLGFGVDLVVDEQARRLTERGFDVTVVVIHADIALPPHPYRLVVLNRIMPLGDFYSEKWVKHALAQCRIDADLWILHTPPFYDWLEFLDGPVLFVEYGAPPGDMFPPVIGGHLDAMAAKRLKGTYNCLLPCDAIVSISRSIHEWMPENAQSFSTVIHLGCDHYPQTSRDKSEALRTSLGILPEDVMILWVGRMQLDNDEQPYKCFQELIALMPLVHPHIERARFVIAGRVSDRDRQKLERGGFTVLANLSASEMGTVYAAADVLVNLSRWEGFNLSLLEAQIQSTPVVAYDLGPHPEIVSRNETGLLAKTPQDMFRALTRISSDHVLRADLSARARLWAAEFNWDAHLDKFEQVILSCAAKRMPRAETAMLRRKIAEEARQEAQSLAVSSVSPLTAQEILGLDGIAFVRTALDALIGPARHEIAEMPWLERLNRGAGKRATLLDMSEFASHRELKPHIHGLRTAVLPARAARLFRRKLGKGKTADLSDSTVWSRLQEKVFIQHSYRVLLGREADPDAPHGWTAALQSGVKRRDVLAQIHFSDEGRGRAIDDPDLQRLLAGYVHDEQPETQATSATDQHRVEAMLETTAPNVQALSGVLPRLSALEASVEAFRSQRTGSTAGRPSTYPQRSALMDECAPVATAQAHAILVAPGAVLDPLAMARLIDAANTTDSDIVFGDEIVLLDRQPFRRLRVNGPFSHHAFLGDTQLGGVIAVHKSLLERLRLPSTTALTGEILLHLVSHAHTITYVPVALCERADGRIGEGRPTIAALQSYTRRLARPTIVAEKKGGKFDVRSPITDPWKVAIIMFVRCDDGELERSLADLRAHTAADSYHLTIVRPKGARTSSSGRAGEAMTISNVRDDTSYATLVNQAVRRAPAKCNLVLLIDGGVSPTAPDWLERLVESALIPETGAVAPKTIYADGSVRHAGIAIAPDDQFSYIARFVQRDDPRQMTDVDRLDGLREVSIVSRHCMLFRRSVFADNGLLNAELGPEAADIDFCCRLQRSGLGVLLDGRVVMLHPDPRPRWTRVVPEDDLVVLRANHSHLLVGGERFWGPPVGTVAGSGRDGFVTIVLPPIQER
ncbi:MAG: hypothetical protein DCF28_03815 [Alphaproteobacteria bacterium]|nr:MAG: hypothetical protein DCF28_03815 [Alphaproteobacteria bacterium]PZO40274.1 MAG: hypothetical protein DCE92_02610 [Alphaproteobacteria bacterium]